MLIATFEGRVTREPKQFGKVVKFTVVQNESKDNKNGYESRFIEVVVNAGTFDGTDSLKLQRGDNLTVVGELKRQKWQKGDGFSDVMVFPRLAIPWAVKQRGEAEDPTAGDGPATSDDPFADLGV